MPVQIHLANPVSPGCLRQTRLLLSRLGLSKSDRDEIRFAREGGVCIQIDQAVTASQELVLRNQLPDKACLQRTDSQDLDLQVRARDFGPVCVQIADVLEAHGLAPGGWSRRKTGDEYWCYEMHLKLSGAPDALRDDLRALFSDRLDVRVEGLD